MKGRTSMRTPLSFLVTLQNLTAPFVLQARYFLSRKHIVTPPVPPPLINFNQTRNHFSISRYIREYREQSQSRELPFLKDIAQLNPNSVTLDFGCGLGRMASAYLMEGGSCGLYYGWEPDLFALKWLRKEYSQQNSFRFGGHPLTASQTYLSKGTQPSENYEDKDLAIPEKESWHKFVEGVKFDLIWTSSIFTHTFPSTTVEILKLFKEIAKPGSWIVNTFLSIDDQSERAMKAGTADRKLPLSVNGIRTYDAKNPLVCTAYTVEQINQIYLEVGFPKPEIRFGSWAGRDNGVTYQDLVIVQMPQD